MLEQVFHGPNHRGWSDGKRLGSVFGDICLGCAPKIWSKKPSSSESSSSSTTLGSAASPHTRGQFMLSEAIKAFLWPERSCIRFASGFVVGASLPADPDFGRPHLELHNSAPVKVGQKVLRVPTKRPGTPVCKSWFFLLHRCQNWPAD